MPRHTEKTLQVSDQGHIFAQLMREQSNESAESEESETTAKYVDSSIGEDSSEIEMTHLD